jgi:3-deoxy-D-manno-octulosonic-acid transferase
MLLTYRFIINILFPLIVILIFFRSWIKKEDKNRFKEKLFSSSFNIKKNLKKKLVWFHAASIGEFKSIVPLIKKMNEKNEFEFLITTVTLSSSQIIFNEFFNQKNIYHRFLPIDKPSLIKSFLDNWSPNLTLFVDSEIWPNFLLEIKKRNIPLVLLNGRITQKTYLRWKLISKFAEKIFQSFSLCLPSSNESMKYLDLLKINNIKYIGNLKLTYEVKLDNLHEENKKILENKKFWCAVSIHKKEDIFCLNTHLKIKESHKNITTIIIPRHIERVKKIELFCKKLNLKSQILSNAEIINPEKDVIIINSYGVISNYLSFCKSVFIGKSMNEKLKQVGGQNPVEAAKLGCKIYHGPYIYNFKEIYELLNKHNISEQIINEDELAIKIIDDLNKKNEIQNNQINLINNLGEEVLNNTYNELNKIIAK